MRFVADRSLTDPEVAARKLVELANAFEPVPDGLCVPKTLSGSMT